MALKNNYITIFFLFLGIFIFFCTTHILHIFQNFLLLNKHLYGEQIEIISQTRFLGPIITTLILTQLINKLSNRIIILFSLFLLIVCTINLIILTDYTLIKINFILISSGLFAYFTTMIMNIIEISNKKKYFFLACIILLWASGYVITDFLSTFLISTNNTVLYALIALLYCINIIIEFLYHNKTPHTLKLDSKFSSLIKNIELQLLTGFVISYVAFDILWYYEAFAFKNKLALVSTQVILNYIYISVFFSIILTSYILNNINKYFANLFLILTLLMCFILLPFYGVDRNWNIFFISLIGICLSAIFICNILILIDKFEAYELRTALFSYFFMLSIGMYAGSLSSSTAYASISINENDFLFSIFAVVGSFICYYFWYFIKYKLYKY